MPTIPMPRDTYGENRTEYPPRIYGWMKTNAAGGFELRTIHPGCYLGMRVPAHVHFVLWGGGYPLQWTEELKFEGGRYITPALVAEDAQLSEFRTISAAEPRERRRAALRLPDPAAAREQFPLRHTAVYTTYIPHALASGSRSPSCCIPRARTGRPRQACSNLPANCTKLELCYTWHRE